MKTYILDTNVLLADPMCFDRFEDNDIVIPIEVIEELDGHKNRLDEVGRNCREAIRRLDEMSHLNSLSSGVKTRHGGCLRIAFSRSSSGGSFPKELDLGQSVDNSIIKFVYDMKHDSLHPESVVLVTKDINVRVKCSSLGLKAEDYRNDKVVSDLTGLYTGVSVVEGVDSEIINAVYDRTTTPIISVDSVTKEVIQPNQIVVLKSNSGDNVRSALTRCIDRGHGRHLQPLSEFDSVFGLKPRNKEQRFSLELLMDPEVSFVTLTGKAGCGKSLLTLAAALAQLEGIGERGTYQRLIVSRPVQPVGKDIGFLPGTIEEKMEPWIAPIKDNLEYLMGESGKHNTSTKKSRDGSFSFKDPYLDIMKQKGLIEIEAISFIRGRSIPNTFIVIDEAQNLTKHELKTIITRVGERSKIVLTGDVEQIDNVHVDAFSNGLSYAIEKFKGQRMSGHVTLLKGERSQLATIASQIL